MLHTEIRKFTGRKGAVSATACIETKDGSIIMELIDILIRWHQNISELYRDDTRGDIPQIEEPIIHREVEAALKRLPMKRSPGPDDIASEMLIAA